jgi:hypothetical protein
LGTTRRSVARGTICCFGRGDRQSERGGSERLADEGAIAAREPAFRRPIRAISLAHLSVPPNICGRDGRLAFRYDGPDYRGFMMASGVLDVPVRSLPAVAEPLPEKRDWNDIFAATPRPEHQLNVVMIWAPWSAHSQIAFTQLDEARDYFARERAARCAAIARIGADAGEKSDAHDIAGSRWRARGREAWRADCGADAAVDRRGGGTRREMN